MASGTIKKQLKINQVVHQFTGITGSAEANVVLTSDLAATIGLPSGGVIFGVFPTSDSGFNGAVYNVFRNGNSLYIKANKALSNATLNMYIYYYI